MIDTVLFDLDGTLLRFRQDAFITAYFREIGTMFSGLGLDADAAIRAVWTGTKAMMANDGKKKNAERFWTAFAGVMGFSDAKLVHVEAACDRFYVNEFDAVREVAEPDDGARRAVRALTAKGYTVALATNPLFPACAVTTRLRWAGLAPDDFRLVTHYSNSAYCKPNAGYYTEIFTKLGKRPEQCLMIGNHPVEDMSAGALGAQTYLVTDFLENETQADISEFQSGVFLDLAVYLDSLPPLL